MTPPDSAPKTRLLTGLFNRVCLQMNVWGLASPSGRVREEMEKEGWHFQTMTSTLINPYYPVSPFSITTIRTPEGERIQGEGTSPDAYRRYRDAHIRAAEKVYGPR